MDIENKRRVIENMVKAKGERATRIWTLVSGFEPLVPPQVALSNLRNFWGILRLDLQSDARELIGDVERILGKSPWR